MGLTGTDLALTTARVGCLRVGAGRVGFVTDDVEGTGTVEPGEVSWHEVKPEDDGEEWDLMTAWSMCAEPPVASFTDLPDPSAPAEVVQLTDTSTPTGEITFWHWEFGDGATSDEQNPTHAYAAAGTYTIELWIASPRGSSYASGTHTVPVSVEGTVWWDDGTLHLWEGGSVYMWVDDVAWPGGPAITDAAGHYSFSGVPDGNILVQVSGNPPGAGAGYLGTNDGLLEAPAVLTLDIVATGV